MWRARFERQQVHSCGMPPAECGDPQKAWFPHRSVCYPTMEAEAAQAKYAELHENKPYHDGTFTSWRKKRSDSHPYHFQSGVTITVAPVDLNPHDHFLGGAEDCPECDD